MTTREHKFSPFICRRKYFGSLIFVVEGGRRKFFRDENFSSPKISRSTVHGILQTKLSSLLALKLSGRQNCNYPSLLEEDLFLHISVWNTTTTIDEKTFLVKIISQRWVTAKLKHMKIFFNECFNCRPYNTDKFSCC